MIGLQKENQRRKMTKFIALISGKGGVGKTTSIINLGSALGFFGKDVIVVDGNLSMANIGIYLGSPTVSTNLVDVLKEIRHISEAIYSHPSGIRVVPGHLPFENFDYDFKKSLEGLNGLSDFVLLDSSVGNNKEVLDVIKVSNEVLIVTTPNLASVTGAAKVAKLCEEQRKKIRGIIITRTKDNLDLTVGNIEDLVGYPVIGIIPEDESVRRSIIEKNSVLDLYPNSVASLSYKQLAASLLGRNYSEAEENKRFFSKLFK